MASDARDILEVLKFELNFLEQGGYGRSVRTPWKPTSIFQDSLSCLNFDDPQRPHPCNECLLHDLVPTQCREENVPCHHIPLNAAGETVDTMERQYTQLELEDAVRNWLRAMIQRIEQERTKKAATALKVSTPTSPPQ
ncbi:MAG TPA: hypothetical protein VFI95_13790 [Terriglobales bacterium]|nr:hypothetical protein [Terriglobales bacterium]